MLSVASGRPVILVAGNGRAADALAGAPSGASADAWAENLVRSGLLRAVDLSAARRARRSI